MSYFKKFVASLALSLAAVTVATPALKAAGFYCWGCTYVGSGWDSELGFYDEYLCDGCIIWGDAAVQ
jgi:hypothetical protein